MFSVRAFLSIFFMALLLWSMSGRFGFAAEVARMAGHASQGTAKKESDSAITPEGNPEDGKSRGPVENKGPSFLEVTGSIQRLESLGTLSSFSEGSLGRDIWAGTKRSDISLFFPALPSSLPSSTVTDLLRRAMLTQSDSSLIESDVKVHPGEDFLTLRLEQILHQGGYQEALDLYARIKDKPYHPRLGRAGVTAMILTGNMALACLESRSIPGKRSDSFWGSLDGWCAASLEPVAGEKKGGEVTGKVLNSISSDKAYRFVLRDFSQLLSLSVLERGVLIEEGRIEYDENLIQSAGSASADLLSSPLYDKNLPSALRIRITAECVQRGLMPIQSLADLYEGLAPPNLEPSSGDKGLKILPFLFRAAEKSKTDQEKWNAVETALGLQPDVGWAPLLPFAPVVGELLPGKISPVTVRRVAGLVLRAGLILPEPWGQRLREDGEGASKKSESTLLLDLAVSIAMEDPLLPEKINRVVPQLSSRKAGLILSISEGFSALEGQENTKNSAYGKLNLLTGGHNYVMPSGVAYDFLVRDAQSKTPGEVILSSAVALQGIKPGDLYPGVLSKVLAGYETVGLHHEARKLAVEAVLGLL